MARKPSVNYWASRKAFCCRIDGVEHVLAEGEDDSKRQGPVFSAATKRFGELIVAKSSGKLEVGDTRIITLCERYIQHLERHGKNIESIKSLLMPAVKSFGTVRVECLKPLHVQEWLDGMTTWNVNTRNTGYAKLVRTLNWNRDQGYIQAHPLKHGKKAPVDLDRNTSRGKEYILSPELQTLLIEEAASGRFINNKGFSDYLFALQQTGARPEEIAEAEAYHYNPHIGAIVYRWNAKKGFIWKNAEKTEKDRYIFLTPELQRMVEDKIRAQGDGFIFRPSRSGAAPQFMDKNRISSFQRLRRRGKVADYLARHNIDERHVILYGFRHSKITAMLKQGLSIKYVADLMGTSVKMIERVYGHLDADLSDMRATFLRFSR